MMIFQPCVFVSCSLSNAEKWCMVYVDTGRPFLFHTAALVSARPARSALRRWQASPATLNWSFRITSTDEVRRRRHHRHPVLAVIGQRVAVIHSHLHYQSRAPPCVEKPLLWLDPPPVLAFSVPTTAQVIYFPEQVVVLWLCSAVDVTVSSPPLSFPVGRGSPPQSSPVSSIGISGHLWTHRCLDETLGGCVTLLDRWCHERTVLWCSTTMRRPGVYNSWKSPGIWNYSWKCWKSPGMLLLFWEI